MKQSFWKKFLSLMLTLVFLCSFALPSFAAEADPVEEPEVETIAGYTLEELVTAFQNGDSEVMEAYLAATAHYQDEQEVPTGPQPRWNSNWVNPNSDKATHSQLTSMALLLYVGDMQNLYGITGSDGYGYKINEWETIWRATAVPDANFTYLWADHFYDPDTGKSWSQLTNKTARTQIEEFYTKAVQSFSTSRSLAFTNLGMALHFVQDVNEPHHAANITTADSNSQHENFEDYAATRIQTVADNFPSSHARYYNFTLSHSPGELVHQAAVTAKGYAAQANDPSRTNWASVADTTLANAACYSAALLYKFAKEVHMI